MSRWGKPTKNKKRRDPRYFLNESRTTKEIGDAARLRIQQMKKKFKNKSQEYAKQIEEDATQLRQAFQTSKKIKEAIKSFKVVKPREENYEQLLKEFEFFAKESLDKMDQIQELSEKLQDQYAEAQENNNYELGMSIVDKMIDDGGVVDQATDQVEVICRAIVKYIEHKIKKNNKQVPWDMYGKKDAVIQMIDHDLEMARMNMKYAVKMKKQNDEFLNKNFGDKDE